MQIQITYSRDDGYEHDDYEYVDIEPSDVVPLLERRGYTIAENRFKDCARHIVANLPEHLFGCERWKACVYIDYFC